MKNHISKICTIVLLIAMLLPGQAGAQTYNTIKANIPFSFTVGKTTFSSGTYLVRRLLPDGSRGIKIDSEDNDKSLAYLTFSVQSLVPKDETTLVFNRYGDQYFLSRIWIGGDETGIQIPKSRTEREVEATYFQKQMKPEIVSLVASQR